MNGDNKKTILLVEDENIIAMVEKKQLENLGYVIHRVSTGEEAVKTIIENSLPIDLILMDIDLGSGIDGTEAAVQILKQKDIPILFLSSHTEPEIVEKTEKITSYGYVVKSSSVTVLGASIKMAFKLFETQNQLNNTVEALQSATEELMAANEEMQLQNEALNKSEEKYRLQFMNMDSYNSMYEVITDAKGIPCDFRFVMVNQAYEKYVGKKANELIGKTLLEVYPETEPYWIDKMKEAFLKGSPLHFENFSSVMNTYTEINLYIPQKGYIAMTTANIDGRKKAEDTLRKNEEKFRKAMEFTPVPIAVAKSNGELVFYNKYFIDTFGYTLQDIPTIDKWFVLAYPDIEYRNSVMNDWSNRVKDAKKNNVATIPAEYLTTCKNGEVKTIEISAFFEKDYSIGLFQDITKRKEAEKTLLNITEQLEHIGQMARIGGWELDLANMQVEFSREAALIHEVDFPYVPPKLSQGREFYPPEVWPEVQATVQTAIEHGTAYDREWPFITAKGNHIWVRVQGFCVKENGKPIKLHGTFQDITERKSQENQLKTAKANAEESEKKWKTLVHSIPDWIAIIDKNNKFSFINNFAEGFDENNVIGVSVLDFISDSSKQVFTDAINKTREINEFHTFEHYAYGDRHTERYYHNYMVPLDVKSGKILIVSRDITKRKQAEIEIKRQLSEKENLLKEVHHRIKNNIASIEGLLSMQADSTLNSEVKNALQDAISRVQSIRVLYENLLFGKDYQDVSAKSYIESLVDSLVAVFSESKNITIEKKIADFSINSKNIISVGIIINELLTNIFKYAFKGKTDNRILIKLDRIENVVTLTIHDNGIGIDERALENKTPGFGLTIVKMLSEQLKGTYTIENDNGTRSCLKFKV